MSETKKSIVYEIVTNGEHDNLVFLTEKIVIRGSFLMFTPFMCTKQNKKWSVKEQRPIIFPEHIIQRINIYSKEEFDELLKINHQSKNLP